MKVQTTSGILVVTENQLAWLEETGELRDMSNYPQALPCFDGPEQDLTKILGDMPAGWSFHEAGPEAPAADPAGLGGEEVAVILRELVDELRVITNCIRKLQA